ncbi:MAG: hypothetical protein ACFFBP_04840 [Promethearchaeota archaeon]
MPSLPTLAIRRIQISPSSTKIRNESQPYEQNYLLYASMLSSPPSNLTASNNLKVLSIFVFNILNHS